MTGAEEAVDAEFRPLAVREEPPSAAPALFGTTDPVEIVTNAVRVADALKAVVVSKKLISNIQGKEYPQVEAWLTLAAMLRLTTICEWSRRVENGWEARVYVRDAAGATVGAAEAQCLATERTKRSWEDYALRSMAQTRATSKALRSVLGFVMVLAGYQATPAEEMPDDSKPAAPPAQPSATDLLIACARDLGAIPAGSREQGIVALKNWATAQGIEWGPGASAKIDAALGALEALEPPPAPRNAPETASENLAQRARRLNSRVHVLFAACGIKDAAARSEVYGQFGYGDDGKPFARWSDIVAAGKEEAVIAYLTQEVDAAKGVAAQ